MLLLPFSNNKIKIIIILRILGEEWELLEWRKNEMNTKNGFFSCPYTDEEKLAKIAWVGVFRTFNWKCLDLMDCLRRKSTLKGRPTIFYHSQNIFVLETFSFKNIFLLKFFLEVLGNFQSHFVIIMLQIC